MLEKSIPKEEHPIAGLVLMVLGIAIAVGAWRYDFGSFESPGAGFLPFFAGVGISGFSLITLLPCLKRRWPPLRELWQGLRWQRAAVVTAFLILYSAFLTDLGFLVATIILMSFLFRVLEPSSWKLTLLAALISTFGFYILFQIWLEAQLPRGLLVF